MLPIGGRILVRVGQKVNATDVIAEANPNNPRVMADVRRALSLPASTPLGEIIQRRIGERVQQGDVLAESGRMFKKVLRSPASGTIVTISNGQILIETEGPVFKLQAGLPGTISELITDRGIIIESTGALLQGVWGNNRTDVGTLLILSHAPEDELTADKMDVSMRGAVIMAGHCSQANAIRMANELPLRGLILGSATADLLPHLQSAAFPVILLEGFGNIPMNGAAFKILSTNEKRDLSLHAIPWDVFSGDRPEALIQLPAAAPTAPESDTFRAGQTVRLHGAPYAGQVATLVSLNSGLTRLPTGLRARAATVRLENNDQVSIPLVNLDVLE